MSDFFYLLFFGWIKEFQGGNLVAGYLLLFIAKAFVILILVGAIAITRAIYKNIDTSSVPERTKGTVRKIEFVPAGTAWSSRRSIIGPVITEKPEGWYVTLSIPGDDGLRTFKISIEDHEGLAVGGQMDVLVMRGNHSNEVLAVSLAP